MRVKGDTDPPGLQPARRVLVIGATGFIGVPLCRHLESMGAEVYAMHRGLGDEPEIGEVILCDRTDTTRLGNLARLERFDVVIDLLAMTVRETLPVLYAFSGRVNRYVLISSADVYRNYEGLHRKGTPDRVEILDEDSPVRTTRYPYKAPDGSAIIPRFPADYDKIPIEGAVRAQTGFEWAILRLPMVFGPADRQRRFASMIWRMSDDRPVLPLERSYASFQTTYGYVENVAEAIATVALSQNAPGATVNIGPEHGTSVASMAHTLARVMEWKGNLMIMDDRELPEHLAGFADNHDFTYALRLDTTRLRERFGYQDTVPLEAALRATVADELQRPRPESLDADYESEDDWLRTLPRERLGA